MVYDFAYTCDRLDLLQAALERPEWLPPPFSVGRMLYHAVSGRRPIEAVRIVLKAFSREQLQVVTPNDLLLDGTLKPLSTLDQWKQALREALLATAQTSLAAQV